VIAENPTPVSREAVEAALEPYRGTFGQLPPMHSAVKQDGKRLYKLARAGREVERTPRMVTITRLDLTAWEPPFAEIEIDCTPGTYIRSLAHDLGAALGVGAHLAALERTASGQFKAADGVSWPVFYAALQAKTWQQYLLPPDLALAGAPAVHLSAEEATFIRLGGYVTALDGGGHEGQLARGYDPDGELCAILERRGDQWKPHKVFDAINGSED
jgi:tRNA pseudouridine55 synthase